MRFFSDPHGNREGWIVFTHMSQAPYDSTDNVPLLSDEELVRLNRYNELTERYYARIFDYMKRFRLHTRHEDAVHDVIIKFWLDIRTGRHGDSISIKAYAFKIARNYALDIKRHEKVTYRILEFVGNAIESLSASTDSGTYSRTLGSRDPEDLAIDAGKRQIFLHELNVLRESDPKAVEVVDLILTEECTPKEVAAIVGCPLSTVYARLNRVINHLRDEIKIFSLQERQNEQQE